MQHFSGGRSNEGGGGGGGVCGETRTLGLFVKSFLPALRGKNNAGTFFHMTQVGLRSLGGFWHTWKFHLKWQLRGCCPEPFNYCKVFSFYWYFITVIVYDNYSMAKKSWSSLAKLAACQIVFRQFRHCGKTIQDVGKVAWLIAYRWFQLPVSTSIG